MVAVMAAGCYLKKSPLPLPEIPPDVMQGPCHKQGKNGQQNFLGVHLGVRGILLHNTNQYFQYVIMQDSIPPPPRADTRAFCFRQGALFSYLPAMPGKPFLPKMAGRPRCPRPFPAKETLWNTRPL